MSTSVQETTSETTIDNEIKPKLRGRIHQIAFYKTIGLATLYTIISIVKPFKLAILIYLLSQLILYGVSSTYHINNWKTERARRLFQKLDHSSIFLLISGTQTSVFLILLPDTKFTGSLLITTWTISVIGILKVFIFNNIVELLDVAIYTIHGVCVVPFFRILVNHVNKLDWVLFFLGGLLYMIGGIIFGVRKPDPFPKVFGFHEIFHLLTVLANVCFMIPIVMKYIQITFK